MISYVFYVLWFNINFFINFYGLICCRLGIVFMVLKLSL